VVTLLTYLQEVPDSNLGWDMPNLRNYCGPMTYAMLSAETAGCIRLPGKTGVPAEIRKGH
jgi:hypothetical protein